MKIIQYKNGIPLKKYKSVTEVQNKKGFSKSHISECLNGKRKTAYGYEWKYQFKMKGNLKYWFKNKKDLIKDVAFLCEENEKKEKEIEDLRKKINSLYLENALLNNQNYHYQQFGVR